MGLVLGVDGGNSKTDVVVATTEGEPVSYVRGGGSNSHGRGGSAGCIETVASLVDLDEPADRAVLFLCGADLPHDIEELTHFASERAWARDLTVDNDTFALLHAGTDRAAAVAVICGSGINCVGRSGERIVRYPALGWETGDWGGAEALGRAALFHANRAADGRGEPTGLVAVIEAHFGRPVAEVGADVHYRRMAESRLGELAPAIVALGRPGGAAARAAARRRDRAAGRAVAARPRARRRRRRPRRRHAGATVGRSSSASRRRCPRRRSCPSCRRSAAPCSRHSSRRHSGASATPSGAGRRVAEVRRFADAEELGRTLASEIVEARPRLLGCPGGRSLRTTYRHLPELPETTLVLMDEYVPVPPTSAHYSCLGFAERELPRARDLWVPDPDEPEAFDERIAAAGGIDVFLLASGASDGHVAMLGPGAPRDGRTAVVDLAETTRRDNVATFPEFRSLDEVPSAGRVRRPADDRRREGAAARDPRRRQAAGDRARCCRSTRSTRTGR